jgi:hypothetical protein
MKKMNNEAKAKVAAYVKKTVRDFGMLSLTIPLGLMVIDDKEEREQLRSDLITELDSFKKLLSEVKGE